MTAFLGLASFLFFKAGRATDLAEDFFDCLAIRFWTGLKGLALVEPFFAAFFGAAFLATFFGAAFFGAAFFAGFLDTAFFGAALAGAAFFTGFLATFFGAAFFAAGFFAAGFFGAAFFTGFFAAGLAFFAAAFLAAVAFGFVFALLGIILPLRVIQVHPEFFFKNFCFFKQLSNIKLTKFIDNANICGKIFLFFFSSITINLLLPVISYL